MLPRVLYVLLFIYSFGVEAKDTILKLYRPYGDVTEQILPQVKTTLIGECNSQSKLIIREDAWRCMSGGENI